MFNTFKQLKLSGVYISGRLAKSAVTFYEELLVRYCLYEIMKYPAYKVTYYKININ